MRYSLAFIVLLVACHTASNVPDNQPADDSLVQ